MAKRKKTIKRKTKRKGMRGLSGSERTKKLGLLLLNVAVSNAVQEGLQALDGAAFMQQKTEAGKEPSKVNFKKAAAHGGLFLAAGAGAIMIDNEYVSEGLKAISVQSSIMLKDSVAKPALGLGADYLDIYADKKDPLDDLNGERKTVQLAGDLSQKFA